MALFRAKKSDMPPDAIMLTEREALEYQIKVMHGWKNYSDTFAFRYGGIILGSVTAFVGMYVNNHYRTKLRLYTYGRLSSYLPIVILPSMLSVLVHMEFVMPDVAVQKKCAVCTELRSSAVQVMTGAVLPCILAPLSATPLAIRYNTYDVPYITREPMKVFRMWQKLTKPVANVLMSIFVGQALLASIITYFEAKSVYNVNMRLAELEYELEHTSSVSENIL